jgi:hypothetical protein
VKLAVVCPEAMVTLAGTVTFALLLFNVTANPALDAAWLIVTLHGVLVGVFKVVLVQMSPVRTVGAVKVSAAVRVTPP